MRLIDRRLSVLLAGVSLLAACAPNPAVESAATRELVAAVAPAPAPVPAEPAPVSSLVREVSIPHSQFVLDNGLTVLVHEDHKAPIVAVSVWYNVGSKDEPKGQTGFAHLFEHLMFYGSDNVREGILPFLEKVGATDYNGSTWFDRTNYYESVPKNELERVLFMESDRMGYLLPAVDQKRLDLQRGVVQNEKRQGDNQPGGLVDYEVLATLFPEGHPYHHDTIGSMADLDAASLADVKKWFISRYGPNNAVITLAGDISADEARTLMTKYFGGIPRGPVNNPAQADVPTLSTPKTIVMKDRVAAVELQRHWAVPGLLSNDLPALDLGASVLGGLASSRLDRILVRDEKLAVGVSASLQPFHRISLMEISATVKPGVDPAVVDKRLDEILSQFLAEGPTADELERAATAEVAGRIRGLEKVGDAGGKAAALAQSELYAHDSDFYKKQLAAYAAVTPDQVRATMSQWLSRPVLKVVLEPGDRAPYEEAKGPPKKRAADIKVASVKRQMPAVGQAVTLDFPTIEHISLSNGIKVNYAQRTAVPLTSVVLSFDAGYASDPVAQRGLQSMTMNLLDEGAAGMSAQAIAEQAERLGARISTGGSADRSTASLGALTANLEPSLKLLTDVVVHPDFNPADVDRLRVQTVTAIAQAKTNPGSMATRALPALLYGENHPYGTTALGDEAAVKAFSRDDFIGFQQHWLRPDNAEIYVVSDLPLAKLTPILETAFGSWQAPSTPLGTKNFGPLPARPTKPRIVLIDRPGSPQSFIYAGEITPADPRADNTALFAGSDVLGGSSASRIFADLREAKGWSYGAYGSPAPTARTMPYIIQAPVQADRTGDSVAALMGHVRDIVGSKGVTNEELARSVASSVGELPGRFETGAAVLGAMQSNALFGRPDNYYELIADRYRALTPSAVDQVLRQTIDPNGFVFVVVGDAAKVKPQLDKLGLPVEAMPAR